MLKLKLLTSRLVPTVVTVALRLNNSNEYLANGNENVATQK